MKNKGTVVVSIRHLKSPEEIKVEVLKKPKNLSLADDKLKLFRQYCVEKFKAPGNEKARSEWKSKWIKEMAEKEVGIAFRTINESYRVDSEDGPLMKKNRLGEWLKILSPNDVHAAVRGSFTIYGMQQLSIDDIYRFLETEKGLFVPDGVPLLAFRESATVYNYKSVFAVDHDLNDSFSSVATSFDSNNALTNAMTQSGNRINPIVQQKSGAVPNEMMQLSLARRARHQRVEGMEMIPSQANAMMHQYFEGTGMRSMGLQSGGGMTMHPNAALFGNIMHRSAGGIATGAPNGGGNFGRMYSGISMGHHTGQPIVGSAAYRNNTGQWIDGSFPSHFSGLRVLVANGGNQLDANDQFQISPYMHPCRNPPYGYPDGFSHVGTVPTHASEETRLRYGLENLKVGLDKDKVAVEKDRVDIEKQLIESLTASNEQQRSDLKMMVEKAEAEKAKVEAERAEAQKIATEKILAAEQAAEKIRAAEKAAEKAIAEKSIAEARAAAEKEKAIAEMKAKAAIEKEEAVKQAEAKAAVEKENIQSINKSLSDITKGIKAGFKDTKAHTTKVTNASKAHTTKQTTKMLKGVQAHVEEETEEIKLHNREVITESSRKPSPRAHAHLPMALSPTRTRLETNFEDHFSPAGMPKPSSIAFSPMGEESQDTSEEILFYENGDFLRLRLPGYVDEEKIDKLNEEGKDWLRFGWPFLIIDGDGIMMPVMTDNQEDGLQACKECCNLQMSNRPRTTRSSTRRTRRTKAVEYCSEHVDFCPIRGCHRQPVKQLLDLHYHT